MLETQQKSSGHFSAPFKDDVGRGTSTDPQTTVFFPGELASFWNGVRSEPEETCRELPSRLKSLFSRSLRFVKIRSLMNITSAKLLFPNRLYLHLPRMCKWILPRIWSVALLSPMPGRKPTKQYGQQCLQPLSGGRIPRCEGQQSLQSMPCTCHYRIARIGVSFRLWLPRRIH